MIARTWRPATGSNGMPWSCRRACEREDRDRGGRLHMGRRVHRGRSGIRGLSHRGLRGFRGLWGCQVIRAVCQGGCGDTISPGTPDTAGPPQPRPQGAPDPLRHRRRRLSGFASRGRFSDVDAHRGDRSGTPAPELRRRFTALGIANNSVVTMPETHHQVLGLS